MLNRTLPRNSQFTATPRRAVLCGLSGLLSICSALGTTLAQPQATSTPPAATAAPEPPSRFAAQGARKPEAARIRLVNPAVVASEAIATASASAAVEHRRVLVVWADPAHRDTRDWEDMMTVASLQHLLRKEFELVIADIGNGVNAEANRATAKALGADVEPGRPPLFTVLESSGTALGHQSGEAFVSPPPKPGEPWPPMRYNSFMIEAFLERHMTPRRAAVPMFDAALAEAKSGDKHLWVRLTSALSPDGMRMERWLADAEVKRVLSTTFVDCKLDIDREQGIEQLLPKFAEADPEDWPWYAVLDGESRVISRSQEAPGSPNLGFPRFDEDVRYFVQWIGAAAPKDRLSTEQLTALAESVKRFTIAERASSGGDAANGGGPPAGETASDPKLAPPAGKP